MGMSSEATIPRLAQGTLWTFLEMTQNAIFQVYCEVSGRDRMPCIDPVPLILVVAKRNLCRPDSPVPTASSQPVAKVSAIYEEHNEHDGRAVRSV